MQMPELLCGAMLYNMVLVRHAQSNLAYCRVPVYVGVLRRCAAGVRLHDVRCLYEHILLRNAGARCHSDCS